MEMCPSANYAQEDMIFLPRRMLPKLGKRWVAGRWCSKRPSCGREGEQVKGKKLGGVSTWRSAGPAETPDQIRRVLLLIRSGC